MAHDKTIQKKMDELKVSWGAQYEIARGLCNGWWTAEDVIRSGVIEKFAGKPNRQSAPEVASHLLQGTQRSGSVNEGNFALWAELDREQEAILENQGRGLGLMDAQWKGETNWYGGKIQQVVELVKLPQDQWKLKLLGMRKGRSHRFARYLGSRRILLLKLPKQLYSEMESLKSWLEQHFVICGRKFVPFAVKDKKVYMCEVNEDVDRSPRNEEGDQYRTTLQDLVEWHNPLPLNSKQEVSKWTSRFDLGLSTSVPALQFSPENIFLIPDEYVQGYPRPNEKAPPHTIFTDGCGYMNGAALMAIGKHMSYTSRPTVVQGRFLGSKGVWMLHPEDRDPAAPPRVWVRDSQLKIHHITGDNWTPDNLRTLHRAHLIFDLLASPRMTLPARLNRLSILNLAHNGVPNEIFVRLMDEGLRDEVNALRRWEGERAMESLWTAVDIACGVTSSRLQRLAAGLQRALGLAGRETDDRASESELSDHSSVATEDLSAGLDLAPVTLGETVVEKLQAGFSPLRDLQLCEDLRQVIKNTLESYIKEYHIGVPQSAEAFIVPDPYGVLQPGQIHFKSSHQPLKDPLQFLNPHTLTGDVLIYRNPARLPSDIQKVEAVEHPELAEYVDVIVLPIRGGQTLASLLAGGDVDGDTGVCVYDPSIVNAFHQPPLTPEPPGFLDKYFQSSGTILRVTRIIADIASPSHGTASRTLQKHLLQGLCDSPVGLYSMYHENCIYRLGYDHADTIRIAHMFNYILDSRKTGLRVRPEVKRKDSTECSGAKPPCLGGDEEIPNNRIPIRRDRSLGIFILDELMAAGAAIQREILTEYQNQITQLSSLPADPDLVRPWKNASEVPVLEEEISQVVRLVDGCQEEWREYWSRPERFRNANKDQQKANDKAFIDGLAQTYATIPDGTTTLNFLGCLDRIKASYAYHKKPAFAWRFAHGELCRIKAESKNSRPFTKDFADVMAVPTAAARVFAQYNGAVLPQE
ncbi:hypothetical protein EIP86_000955 [Pleurotus ostreatoroseus]|nr:hypothetical protein EIP86_000955 [Pleurotus ostreatoroseus]